MASEIPGIDSLVEKATKAFEARFGSTPQFAAKAPGRVNLIGEHTDYNDGFVFPMALPLVTVIVGSPTSTDLCRVETLAKEVDDPKYIEFEGKNLKPGIPKWANYVKGVVNNFEDKPSFDAVVVTSVPLGGGVSSSASVEVAMHTFIEQFSSRPKTTNMEKILLCQKAEHKFAGMPCGIMDQFISVEGKTGHAVLIDCRSHEHRLVPMKDPSIVVLVTNSNVKHELTGSEYPTRRRQCESSAEVLGVKSLRDASEADLDAKKGELDEVTYRRARHVITEIKRTEEAATVLENEDYTRFGQLMVDSHNSLRDDYEVSCAELDQLVEVAMEKKSEGVFGARMMGGGFGGCTVTLVKANVVDSLIEHIAKKYNTENRKATFFVCPASSGADVITIS